MAEKKLNRDKKKTAVADNTPDAVPYAGGERNIHQERVNLLPPELITETLERLRNALDEFSDETRDNLTALQRRRKIGAGIKNYGFIDKASDLAMANPRFVQFFNINYLKNAIRNIEACREIVILAQSIERAASNAMLVYSGAAYEMAADFYNTVQRQSRRGDPEATAIFRSLQPFFKRPKRTNAEPTQKELERDLHALIHGKKDGKIVVENFAPKASDGARKIIDDVHKGKAMAKESAEAEVDD